MAICYNRRQELYILVFRKLRSTNLQGAPSFVRLYEYPRLEGPGAIVASKSFYRADNVKFLWNKKGITQF